MLNLYSGCRSCQEQTVQHSNTDFIIAPASVCSVSTNRGGRNIDTKQPQYLSRKQHVGTCD